MAINRHGISPDLVIHPGETISDILEDRNLTQKELAKRAGVSEPYLSDVIRGKKDISKSLAMGLEYALGVPRSFWLNLQANYDAEVLSLQEEGTIQEEERKVLSSISEVVNYLKKYALISGDLTQEQTIIQLRKHFKVSSLTGLRELAPSGAFRMSGKAAINKDVLGAWLCLCKVQGEGRRITERYDEARIDLLIEELKSIMCNPKGDLQRSLTTAFAQYGIDFSIMHNFRGAPVQGYINRKEDGTYQIVMTIRGAYADVFWFSLFHELGHIANGDLSKPGSFIDADDNNNTIRESAADRFARDKLLNPDSYTSFISRGMYSLSSIRSFAQTQAVPPYIIIGRLQKEEKIPWSRFSSYKTRYKWAE